MAGDELQALGVEKEGLLEEEAFDGQGIDEILQHVLHKSGIVEYYVSFEGFGPEENRWYTQEEIPSAGELIDEYRQLHGLKYIDEDLCAANIDCKSIATTQQVKPPNTNERGEVDWKVLLRPEYRDKALKGLDRELGEMQKRRFVPNIVIDDQDKKQALACRVVAVIKNGDRDDWSVKCRLVAKEYKGSTSADPAETYAAVPSLKIIAHGNVPLPAHILSSVLTPGSDFEHCLRPVAPPLGFFFVFRGDRLNLIPDTLAVADTWAAEHGFLADVALGCRVRLRCTACGCKGQGSDKPAKQGSRSNIEPEIFECGCWALWLGCAGPPGH